MTSRGLTLTVRLSHEAAPLSRPYTVRMSLLFIRHGETPLNAARIMQPADTPLSERGLAQAQAVAERLAALRPIAVLSSDMPRALQTAEAIAAAAGGLPVETTPLLQERNFGDLRGRPYDTLGFDPLTFEAAPAGGESIPDFLRRVEAAFAHAVRLRGRVGGPLVVVSHGLVIRALLDQQIRVPPGTVLPARIGNTSVTHVGAEPPHEAELIDCTTHLQGRTAEDGRSLSGG